MKHAFYQNENDKIFLDIRESNRCGLYNVKIFIEKGETERTKEVLNVVLKAEELCKLHDFISIFIDEK